MENIDQHLRQPSFNDKIEENFEDKYYKLLKSKRRTVILLSCIAVICLIMSFYAFIQKAKADSILDKAQTKRMQCESEAEIFKDLLSQCESEKK